MNDLLHRAHGLAGDETPPDWPPLTIGEIDDLLRGYPQLGTPRRIGWHSPRPLSAACLVQAGNHRVFVKRHHQKVRTAATLSEEHRLINHLRGNGLPIPAPLRDTHGATAVASGDWVYEVHQCAAGSDLYRDAVSWQPLPNRAHAVVAGQMLATLHDAAADYAMPQRDTHILVARSELICAADPVATLRAQLPQRPGLADYLRDRDWPRDFARLLGPHHAAIQPQLAGQARLWTHGDWHVSNLCWSGDGDDTQITDVLDFGLAAANFALFDLATAIERNAIAWLNLDTEGAHVEIACALIEGYRQLRPLDRDDIHLLADLLRWVHVDFALSEVEYYHTITRSHANADVAYDTFLRGHADWFDSADAQRLLQAIRDCA